MRIVLFLITVSITQAFAINAYAQTTRLSLDFKNETIINILEKIEDQSEFYFMFDQTVIDVNQRRSINCKNKSITNVLDEIFKDSGITYKIEDRQIALSSSKIIKLVQQQSISGKVTDENGQPLPGVTVVIKGTTIGTVTDMDGKYTISNIPDGTTLQFSFVGMLTQEITVGTQTEINVTLAVDAIGIEEVVAIGYGIRQKKDIIGSVSVVNVETLKLIPSGSAVNALQGQASGVTVVNSGAPGVASQISVRGMTSLGNNNPLVWLDGVEGNLDLISANEFESVQVRKEA
ncbi:MAG: carboxypeptidase-like regulatory domain-containing protein, partial [Draconibacterium sp.]|nr:carboxypeptidase-like regulatory domain-containing protein [Draconibacterium sp.]